MLNLRALFETETFAFCDLVEKVRDSNFKIPDASAKVLSDHSMVQDGLIHSSVRNIVRSAVEGEGIEMQLVSPIREKEQTTERPSNVN
jgi:hypothetical protein